MFRYNLFMPVRVDNVPADDFGISDPNATRAPVRQQNILLSYTKLFSPTFFMTATGGFFRFRQHNQGFSLNEDVAGQTLGLRGVGPDAFPALQHRRQPGLHQFRHGQPQPAVRLYELRIHRALHEGIGRPHVQIRLGLPPLSRQRDRPPAGFGVFDFANTDTRGLNPDGSVIGGTGADLASFLIGQADRARVQANPTFGRRSWYTAGFFQDDWRGQRQFHGQPRTALRVRGAVHRGRRPRRRLGPRPAPAVRRNERHRAGPAGRLLFRRPRRLSAKTPFAPTRTTSARASVSPTGPAATTSRSSAAGSP